MRDGARFEVEREQLVLGDLVLLRTGERCPADLRVIRADDCQVRPQARREPPQLDYVGVMGLGEGRLVARAS